MPFHVSTHASLLARLGTDGDEDAWREFHDRYHALVRGFARVRNLQAIDADDIAQEVLMAVHQSIRTFDYDPAKGRFRGYLKTIALRSIWRRQAKANHIEDETLAGLASDPELEAQWEAEWRQYHLRLAMTQVRQEFDASETHAFELLALEGRATSEVSLETGLEPDRLYRIKSRILTRLRDLIARQVAEEG